MTATPSTSPASLPPARRLLRAALAALLIVAVVLASLAAGLWWWSGREGSLATALDWLGNQKEIGLQAQDTSGSLRRGGRIGTLSWQAPSGGMRLQASQLQLQWDLAALLQSAWSGQYQIHLQQLSAHTLRLEPSPLAEPSQPPASLKLPLPVRVDTMQVQDAVWAGSTEVHVQDLAGSYVYDGQQHQLTLSKARYAQGQYQGQTRLQAAAPMQLQVDLRGQLQSSVPGSTRQVPLTLQAQAQGPLAQLQVQARLDSTQAGVRSQAELQATVAPWQDPPLPQARAQLHDVNLAALWPQAPATRLSGQARIQPEGARWRFETDVRNSASGPWNQGALPVDALQAKGQWQDGALLIESLQAWLGPGQVQMQGRWTPAAGKTPGWRVQVHFDGLQPARIDSRWPAQTLQGQASAERSAGASAIAFDARLNGGPARAGDALAAWKLVEAQAQGQWQAGTLQLDQLLLRSSDARLQASGRMHLPSRRGQAQATLQAPGLQAKLRGTWPLAQGAGSADVQATNARQALRWVRGLPGLPASLVDALALRVEGQAGMQLEWPAGLADASIQARLDLPVLELPGKAGQTQASRDAQGLRDVRASVQGRLSQAQVQLQGRMNGPRPLRVQTQGEISLPPAALKQALDGGLERLRWTVLLRQLELAMDDPASGPWTLRNAQPLALGGSGRSVQAEPGQLQLLAPPRAGQASALLAWQSLRWQGGDFQSVGSLRGLPLSWAELFAGPVLQRAGMVGDLVFDGRWDVQLGAKLQLDAELQRRSGDLSLHAETGQGLAARVSAGVRDARLSLRTDGDALLLGWRWDSERAGQTDGQLRTRLQQQNGQWQWPQDAPLSGQLQARLPRLGVWSALAPPGWRLRGSLTTQLSVSGTRAQPLLTGPLQADDLALRSAVDGIELGRGRLRAQFEGERLRLDEFTLRGPGNEGGSLQANGQASWAQGMPQVQLQARLNKLRASVRSDRQLTVSGELQARLQDLPQAKPVEITGQLRVDPARIRLPDEGRPQLDADVQVRPGAAAPATPQPAKTTPATPIALAVRLDLGDDFRIEGRGAQAQLRGSLAVTANSLDAPPRMFGSITTASGQYRAYGQRLDIDRGLLRFTGPPDNPALDILAIRPNLTQRVGVQITGTALLPRVRLYAEPELPEAEKLAWLVLGRSGASGGAEAAVLQQAAIALLGNRSAANRGGLAASLGLDELSLRGGTTQADGTSTGGAIAFGKRLSSNFYAVYQSSLSGALGTLFLFYELSQRVTVRAQTGAEAAIDLIYTLPYD